MYTYIVVCVYIYIHTYIHTYIYVRLGIGNTDRKGTTSLRYFERE